MGIVNGFFVTVVHLGLECLVFIDLADAFVGKPHIALGVDAAALQERFPLVVSHFASLYRAPFLAVAVESAVAGDCDVMFAAGREGRCGAVSRETFPVRSYCGIVGEVFAEKHQRAAFEMKFDVVFKCNRAGVPDSFRNHEAAAALGGEVGHCLGEGFGVESDTIVDTAEVSDLDLIGRNHRGRDLRLVDWEILVVGTVVSGLGGGACHLGETHKQAYRVG